MIGIAPQHQHCFVVPAYGSSPYLADCLRSLRSQSVPSDVVVVTSTPSEEMFATCAQFGITPHVHQDRRGIASDWNQALARATSAYVTIAHQDDVYYEQFVNRTLDAFAGSQQPVLAFTDYVEFTQSGVRERSRLLKIKRLLLELAFLGRSKIGSQFEKLNALRFACPIPCPAVTLNTRLFTQGFDESYQVNLDWATWISASRIKGEFVWIREPLMGHRIHGDSETSSAILDGRRQAEDLRILQQLWPTALARIIANSYSAAYASNESNQ